MDSEKTEASDIAKSAELLLEKNTTGDVLFWVFEKKMIFQNTCSYNSFS